MKSILIVDDSATVRKVVSMSLNGQGYALTEASDGHEGFLKAKSKNFDCVITDVNMPNKDGITLIKELRALPVYKKTPMLIITTETNPTKMQFAKDAGATGWIVKPFTPEQLIQTVKKVIS